MNRSAPALLFWGFQGTIDYRVQLEPADFDRLGIALPEEDLEVFIDRDRLNGLLAEIRGWGREVRWNTGGSPLISALTAQHWQRASRHRARSFFLGNVPSVLGDELSPEALNVVRYARMTPKVAGTLSLEHIAGAKKVMLAVPDGRWLDEDLAAAGIAGLQNALRTEDYQYFGLGVGGLNKASLPLLSDLMEQARSLPGLAFLYVAGGSFNPDLVASRGEAFWDELDAVLMRADVISVNREEYTQLAGRFGTDWPSRYFTLGEAKAVVRHSRFEAGAWTTPALPAAREGELRAMMGAAGHAAAVHAGRSATGLGARFDAVLSAVLLMRWPTFANSD